MQQGIKMKMNIEKAKQENFDEINVIAREVHDLHCEYRPDIFKRAEKPISQDYYNSLLGTGRLYIAKDNANAIKFYEKFGMRPQNIKYQMRIEEQK